MERNSNSIQFYKRKTKTDLIEIVDSFGIGKVKIGFRTYNLEAKPGERLKSSVDFYMNIDEFELLCHNLISGNILAKLKKGIEIPPVYKGNERDGKVYSRVLKLNKSNKGVFFNVQEGPGKSSPTGAVMPAGEATNKVSISLSNEEIKSFALQGKRACDVYYMKVALGQIVMGGGRDSQSHKANG